MVSEKDLAFRCAFGQRLRERRESLGMTRKEFAGAIGVSAGAVTMYELGDRVPTLTVLVQISQVLHMSLDELVGYDYKAPSDYDRYSQYLNRLGYKVTFRSGVVHILPLTTDAKRQILDAKLQMGIPGGKTQWDTYFAGKETFVAFMQEIEQRADKKWRRIMDKKTYAALHNYTETYQLVKGMMKLNSILAETEGHRMTSEQQRREVCLRTIYYVLGVDLSSNKAILPQPPADAVPSICKHCKLKKK